MISTAVIKRALRIDYDTDDAELDRLQASAIAFLQSSTGTVVEQTTTMMYLADWSDVTLASHPEAVVDGIAYTDTDSAAQSLSTDNYWIDRASGPLPVLRFVDPPTLGEGANVEVSLTVGTADLDPQVEQAIIAIVGHWYSAPEAAQPIQLHSMPFSLKCMIENLSIHAGLR